MSNKINPIVPKDSQYWEDILYMLKKTAQIGFKQNEETEKRIQQRMHTVPQQLMLPDGPVKITPTPEFKVDFEKLFDRIVKRTIDFTGKMPNDISECTDAVKTEMAILEVNISTLKAEEERDRMLSRCKE